MSARGPIDREDLVDIDEDAGEGAKVMRRFLLCPA